MQDWRAAASPGMCGWGGRVGGVAAQNWGAAASPGVSRPATFGPAHRWLMAEAMGADRGANSNSSPVVCSL